MIELQIVIIIMCFIYVSHVEVFQTSNLIPKFVIKNIQIG